MQEEMLSWFQTNRIKNAECLVDALTTLDIRSVDALKGSLAAQEKLRKLMNVISIKRFDGALSFHMTQMCADNVEQHVGSKSAIVIEEENTYDARPLLEAEMKASVTELKRQVECENEFIENVIEISCEEEPHMIDMFKKIQARLSDAKSHHQQRANRLLNIISHKERNCENSVIDVAETTFKKARRDPDAYRRTFCIAEEKNTFHSPPPISPPPPPPLLTKHCVANTAQGKLESNHIKKGKKKNKRGACHVHNFYLFVSYYHSRAWWEIAAAAPTAPKTSQT
jgi:hypothetical protein